MDCDACMMLTINGVACHETGCPNAKEQYVDGEWVTVHECRECGSDYLDGEECCTGFWHDELDTGPYDTIAEEEEALGAW